MGTIGTYVINHYSSSGYAWETEIACWEDAGQSMASSTQSGFIRFFADGQPVPTNEWVGGNVGGVPIVNYPARRFDEIVTTLRDEDDVEIRWYSPGTGMAEWAVTAGRSFAGDMDPI